ncbi:MAG: hypothetical protein GXY50_00270 [Syntrophomonadaceae bacterium]|nr:hypothetical protein [Syntrophomonadaceae bacterium]
MAQMPTVLTPENIAAVAQNAEQIMSLLRGKEQPQPVASSCGPDRNSVACCCPGQIKFFIFGNAWINNYNSQCPEVPF